MKSRNINGRALAQAGFTLIDLLIAIAICGILGSGIVTALYQINSVNSIDHARVTAVKQVESAIHYLNRDMQMSQKVEVDGSGYWLRLSWVKWDNNDHIQVEYTLADGVLKRKFSVNSGSPQFTTVAQYITAVSAEAPGANQKAWNIQITASANYQRKEAAETRLINVIPRPGS